MVTTNVMMSLRQGDSIPVLSVETPDALRITQDRLDSKNFYAFNPAFVKGDGK